MEIVYSSSDAYSSCTGISLLSLYENNKDVEELNVHILSTDITHINKERLNSVAERYGRKLNIIDAKQDFIDEAERLNLKLLRGAYNTYSRVVLNHWFSSLDKIMVVDSDTLVCGSLKPAWDLDISNFALAAVPELAMYTKEIRFEDPNLLKDLDTYYNMGICVVNLKKWREEEYDSLIFRSIRRDNPVFRIADQSIINKYLKGKIARLPLNFNYYTPVHNVNYNTICKVFPRKIIFDREEFEDARRNPAIIHYFGHSYERPWFKHSVAIHQAEYQKLRANSPWKDEPYSKWRETAFVYKLYDCICYILLVLKLNAACLKFRYIWGQKIQELLGTHR